MLKVEEDAKEGKMYAPICSELKKVVSVYQDKYFIEDVTPRGLFFDFKKGFGITRWFVNGGYEIEITK